MSNTPTGTVIAEGKTKKIIQHRDPAHVVVVSNNVVTAGNGAKRAEFAGKGACATRTTCNVFHLLRAAGIPVAFEERLDETSFLALKCDMILVEVVARGLAWGSYLKRNPKMRQGQIFPAPLVEFFLKTTGQVWRGESLIVDDPLMGVHEMGFPTGELFHPNHPAGTAKPFHVISLDTVGVQGDHWERMAMITKETYLILQKAWMKIGPVLVDFKIEFGIDPNGRLCVADVIDNDSWRVVDAEGNHFDKQLFRNGADIAEVAAQYRVVADFTDQF